ncbi:MAG: hypothetical protein Kow0056_01810 [Coriobacteriia bacterium]
MAALVAFAVALACDPASAQPASTEPNPVAQLDEATREAVQIEEEIAELEAERVAIETRLEVLHERIDKQRDRVETARQALKRARAVYGQRVVAMYKRGSVSPLLIILQADSFQDFVARSTLMTRLVAHDRDIWREQADAAAKEHFEELMLEDLLAQERELRDINESRQLTLERALDRQRALVERLTKEAEEYLAELRAQREKDRQAWVDSSIPVGSEIQFVPAVVEPYDDRTYLVPAHQPRRYRTTGEETVMVCSWYGNEFNGRPTASGQIFNEDDFTAASRTLPFGTTLALTRGDRRIIVVVNDRGPFIAGRDLDLSKAAAFALGFSGVEPVHVEFVEPLPDAAE